MFATDDVIVYGIAGLCKVIGYGKSPIPGDSRNCYQLRPLHAVEGMGSLIHTPIEGGTVAIRNLHSRDELLKLAENARNAPPFRCDSERQKRERYKQALASCDFMEFLSILHSVEHRREQFASIGKRLSDTDERYAQRAADAIFAEACLVMDCKREKIAEMFGIPARLI